MSDPSARQRIAGSYTPADLTPEGIARRDEMLDTLLLAVDRRAGARRRTRIVTGVALVALVGALVPMVRVMSRAPSLVRPSGQARVESPPQASGTLITIQRVETDPTIVERFAPTPTRVAVERISDDELLRTLSALGRYTALARIDGALRLTNDVVDHPTPVSAPGSPGSSGIPGI